MAKVFRCIDRLGLSAQDDLGDHVRCLAIARIGQQTVEARGLGPLAQCPFDVQRLQVFRQRGELGIARLVVDTVDQRMACFLQALGRGDVRLDHELLDQLVSVEAFLHGDLVDGAILSELDPPFGQIEIQWRALFAGLADGGIGAPERLENSIEERSSALAGMTINRRLRLVIGKARGRLHHRPYEAVVPFCT